MSPAPRLAYVARSVLPSDAANSVHVARMCAALAGQGADVTLFAHRGTPVLGIDGLMDRYGLARGFGLRLYDMQSFLDRKTWRGRALRQARREGRTGVLTRDAQVAAKAARKGFATVYEVHHPPRSGSRSDRAMRAALEAGAQLVAITAQLARHLEAELALPPGTITVLQDGADRVQAPPEPAPLRRDGRLVAGYAGSLLEGKGAELIMALAPLLPEVDFVVLGGPEARRRELEQAAPRNLRLLPRVSPGEVAAYIAAFDIALLPNARRMRGASGGTADIGAWTSPLKAFEYMALGRPILASDLPNLREVFAEDVNARLCAPDDAAAWADALRKLAGDAEARARLGARARADLDEHYSWDARARRMLPLLGG